MSCRAFSHDKNPGDPFVSYDVSRQVPLESLRSLKYETFFIEGPDYVQLSRKIALDLGFLLTAENCKVVWDFTGTGNHAIFDDKSKVLPSKPRKYMASLDFLIVVVSGTHCVDIEDPISGSWIRIERAPGTVQLVPAGSLGYFVPCVHKSIVFVKGAHSEYQLIDEDSIEPVLHGDYLRRISGL
ncbi:hypothetical protein C8R41DRAFT_864683 [Lentinula lateritia]|uniref:Uncharacterized protein n=1 Tax=Lentinula lateritia TaxID=40482 RepID=A0ABQ8VVB9_9AGAR|nr:hypothetical protein C8R41DRAFT_864683 [Lentinula lateritia]